MRARVWIGAAALTAVVAGGLAAAYFLWPSAHLGTPGDALARVVVPRFAGEITAVDVRSANGVKVPVQLRNGQVVPNRDGRQRRAALGRADGAATRLGKLARRSHRPPKLHDRDPESSSARALAAGEERRASDGRVRPGRQHRLARRQAGATSSAATERSADRPGRDRLARRRCHRCRRRCAHVGAPGCSRARELVPLAPVPAAARQAPAGLGRRPEARVHADILEPGRRGAGHPAAAALPRDAGELALDRRAHAGLPATRPRLRARHGGARAAPAGRSPRRPARSDADANAALADPGRIDDAAAAASGPARLSASSSGYRAPTQSRARWAPSSSPRASRQPGISPGVSTTRRASCRSCGARVGGT